MARPNSESLTLATQSRRRTLNRDASDFMHLEYELLVQVYESLRNSQWQWFKFYISLVAAPFTLVITLAQLTHRLDIVSPFELPPGISYLLIIVAILGLATVVPLVSVRMSMIRYARTINCVRAFFSDHDTAAHPNFALRNYLVLPCTDELPKFWEPSHSTFWMVISMGLVDGFLCGSGIASLGKSGAHPWDCGLPGLLLITTVSLLIHLGAYWCIAHKRENDWEVKRPEGASS